MLKSSLFSFFTRRERLYDDSTNFHALGFGVQVGAEKGSFFFFVHPTSAAESFPIAGAFILEVHIKKFLTITGWIKGGDFFVDLIIVIL